MVPDWSNDNSQDTANRWLLPLLVLYLYPSHCQHDPGRHYFKIDTQRTRYQMILKINHGAFVSSCFNSRISTGRGIELILTWVGGFQREADPRNWQHVWNYLEVLPFGRAAGRGAVPELKLWSGGHAHVQDQVGMGGVRDFGRGGGPLGVFIF